MKGVKIRIVLFTVSLGVFSILLSTGVTFGQYNSIVEKQKEIQREKIEEKQQSKNQLSTFYFDVNQIFNIVVSTIKEMEKSGVKFVRINYSDTFYGPSRKEKSSLNKKIVMIIYSRDEAYEKSIEDPNRLSPIAACDIGFKPYGSAYISDLFITLNNEGDLVTFVDGTGVCKNVECSSTDKSCVKSKQKDIQDCVKTIVNKLLKDYSE